MAKLVVGVAVAVVSFSVASCAGGTQAATPAILLELEQSRELDPRATETCTESLSGSTVLIAASDSTAGQIRQMYERNEVADPSSIDLLPADPATYAALCLYDSREVADFPFDLVAYWVSSDSAVGGTMVLAAWNDN
jgi:hypothetical protein